MLIYVLHYPWFCSVMGVGVHASWIRTSSALKWADIKQQFSLTIKTFMCFRIIDSWWIVFGKTGAPWGFPRGAGRTLGEHANSTSDHSCYDATILSNLLPPEDATLLQPSLCSWAAVYLLRREQSNDSICRCWLRVLATSALYLWNGAILTPKKIFVPFMHNGEWQTPCVENNVRGFILPLRALHKVHIYIYIFYPNSKSVNIKLIN